MKIVQVLPALNSGGVERGTVEFARYLVDQGHQSMVISAGGSLASQLEQQGSRHIAFPVHKKNLFSLRHVIPLSKLLLNLEADIIHVRSRLPAWLVWLAVGRKPRSQRPALISTFHGLYSKNRYSEIMACGDQVIAISQCVYDYIVDSYPRVDKQKVSIVHRGVDTGIFHSAVQANDEWKMAFFAQHTELAGKNIVLFPGRLTVWKGHKDFLTIMALLKNDDKIVGLIAGHVDPQKEHYLAELQRLADQLGINHKIRFIDAVPDVENVYALSKVVCNFSLRPEPFGRTVIEALACGIPVVAYDTGGPSESLRACFTEGLIKPSDYQQAADKIRALCQRSSSVQLSKLFTLDHQAQKTLDIYQRALND
ncbi:MAG: glycosyltransferase family 4 protein [Pseudomonadota bacterium]